ncbi:MAG: hypothetical protein HUU06_09390 [Planctomycetaceae bacterium]|nr:hypothetical protein [Planctomycetota bacterium]NUN52982.1 hypothetical protein [Planctomycetaceae bacterium]
MGRVVRKGLCIAFVLAAGTAASVLAGAVSLPLLAVMEREVPSRLLFAGGLLFAASWSCLAWAGITLAARLGERVAGRLGLVPRRGDAAPDRSRSVAAFFIGVAAGYVSTFLGVRLIEPGTWMAAALLMGGNATVGFLVARVVLREGLFEDPPLPSPPAAPEGAAAPAPPS